MRLHELTIKNLTRFAGDPVSINFDELGPGLVALVGPNGSGKTTVAESVPGGLYREMPSRPGSLYGVAHGRDALIQVEFEDDGRYYCAQVQIDADQTRTSAYLYEDGEPVNPDGKTGTFDEAIAERFGSKELFLASVFAAQTRRGSLLEMKKGERKALFAELLGLGHLDELAGRCREHAAQYGTGVTATRQRISELEERCAGIHDLEGRLVGIGHRLQLAEEAIARAHQSEQEIQKELGQALEAAARVGGLKSAYEAAQQSKRQAQQAVESAKERQFQVNAEWDVRRDELDEALRSAQQMGNRAHERHGEAVERLTKRKVAAETILAREDDVAKAAERLMELEQQRDALAEKRERLAAADRTVGIAAQTVDRAIERLKLAREAASREQRSLSDRAALIDKVPCGATNLWVAWGKSSPVDLSGTCPLLKDARAAREAAGGYDIDARTRHEREAVEQAEQDYEQAAAEYQALEPDEDLAERLADLADEIRTLQEIADEGPEIAAARRELALIEEQKAAIDRQRDEELEEARKAYRRAEEQRELAEAAHRRHQELEASRVQDAVFDLERAEKDLAEAKEAYDRERTASDQARVDRLEDELYAVRGERKEAEAERDRAVEERSEVRARLEQLKSDEQRLIGLRTALRGAEQELGDWNLLAQALGKDGVQALEVDAAGPEVAALTNELLESCYGPRFSISFETLREKKSARGEFSEVFEIRVYDGVEQRTVEDLSGGEKVIVGEAINLALAVFNARKSGVRWQTLFRDETAGALDPENAGRYVAMLRRALELGGFTQCVFVAHLPEVWEQADARVHFDDGAVRVAA